MTTTTPYGRPEAALTRAVECWNAGDLGGYLEVYAEDVQLHGFAPEPMDKGAARAFYEGMFAAFPDNRLELHDTFGSGNLLTTRFTLTGRHDGNFMGVPATGTQVALPGITIMHFRGDTCVERWTCADNLGLLVQIGAVLPPS